jgi:hypothetical protein
MPQPCCFAVISPRQWRLRVRSTQSGVGKVPERKSRSGRHRRQRQKAHARPPPDVERAIPSVHGPCGRKST